MLRIGEAAKKFNVSNRTLRYWEQKGILESTRSDSGYRYYNNENSIKIKQIVLLRKLKMPISDIEDFFVSNNLNEAVDILSRHLLNLNYETEINNAVIVLVEELIYNIKAGKNLKQVFLLLEEHCSDSLSTQEQALQILFSERNSIMFEKQLRNVRIVKMPPLQVAAYCTQSTNPENDCGKVFNKFVLENKLHQRSDFRFLGFNNPSPTEGNPVYGYEMWATIPENFNVPEPLEKKHFTGGLYASISTNMNEIGERWQLLCSWVENSEKYDSDFSLQWLEECCMDFKDFISDDTPDNEKQLDLLIPVKLK